MQAVKLAKNRGSKRSPEDSLNIAEENQQLRKRIKALEKENKRLSEMNEFLEDTATFFAAARQKSGKNKDRCIGCSLLLCSFANEDPPHRRPSLRSEKNTV